MSDKESVQVALRVRPLISSEIAKGCNEIIDVFEDLSQVRIKNTDKAFSYNYVFGCSTEQVAFYTKSVAPLIPNLFKGYNVTILAYGQTGSGKTFSMGTAYCGEANTGVIPRAVNDIFTYVNDNFSYDFMISVSFMELYQECLYDLLSTKPRDQCTMEIREDVHKGIFIPGLTEIPVTSAEDALNCLSKGSIGRATSSTNMNQSSSRSHAVFTINISMTQKGSSDMNKTAKFHLVDLAGSERSKKTGATGQTFKEGININKGLLALGNVISALGDEKSSNGFIGYRDSNLTRLLKDSLGGNSITLMIACVSSADYNLEETISTLRYADRARKIKNKPIVNEDPKAAEINRLNKLVRQLKTELLAQGGPSVCPAEVELIKKELNDVRLKNRTLCLKLSTTLNENAALLERILIIQSSNENLAQKLKDLRDEYDITLNNLNISLENCNVDAIKEHVTKLQTIQMHFTEIDNEHKRNEDEIRKHELSFARASDTSVTTEKEINERQESHTDEQMAINNELQKVTQMLAQKENLAKQIANNNNYMVDLAEMVENEAKLMALEKEKEDLIKQHKPVQESAAHGVSKISEQRRKRVLELEAEIQSLKKKVQEQARLIKVKEKNEQKIRQLNLEIQNMKATKVKLIKSMRQESEKFRSWKIERERALSKLKDQDRKRQNQIMKMESIHSRQTNVLKRKVEEAAAINKRLKDALALRKAAQDSKLNGKIERLGPWIQRELDVHVNLIEAKTTLDMLMEDRATLNEQLNRLKDAGEDSNASNIKQLEEDIEIRSAQIQELQQKILDSDEDSISKKFDNVQTMAEAKYTLKVLFDSIGEIKRKEAEKDYKIQEQQSNQSEMERKLVELEEKLKCSEIKLQDELANIERENEEKVYVLLRQLRGKEINGQDEELKERCRIQLETNQKLQEQVEKLQNEVIELNNKNTEIMQQMESKKSQKRKKNTSQNSYTDDENIIPETPQLYHTAESSFENEEDLLKDPDWRKTPLGKRVQRIRANSMFGLEKRPSKRNSEGGCNCKGTCGTRTCGCRKVSNICDFNCKCSLKICINRNENNMTMQAEQDESAESLNEESHFKKPRKTGLRKLLHSPDVF